jgi:hypothetical protein
MKERGKRKEPGAKQPACKGAMEDDVIPRGGPLADVSIRVQVQYKQYRYERAEKMILSEGCSEMQTTQTQRMDAVVPAVVADRMDPELQRRYRYNGYNGNGGQHQGRGSSTAVCCTSTCTSLLPVAPRFPSLYSHSPRRSSGCPPKAKLKTSFIYSSQILSEALPARRTTRPQAPGARAARAALLSQCDRQRDISLISQVRNVVTCTSLPLIVRRRSASRPLDSPVVAPFQQTAAGLWSPERSWPTTTTPDLCRVERHDLLEPINEIISS